MSNSDDEDVRKAQARLDARKAEVQGAEQEDLGAAQAQLEALRRRAGVKGTVRELPWLRMVARLDEHAALPSTAAALAGEEGRLLAIARRSLASLARRFELPEHPDLWDVALADAPRETAALAAFRGAFEHRARAARRHPLARVVGGPAGTGKTAGMAWSLLHQRPGEGLRAQLAGDAPALFVAASAITSTPRNGFSTNTEAWERWLSAPVLAVDDAGTEPGDPALLASLFVERWARPTVTLVTTNLSEKPDQDEPEEEFWWRRYANTRLADRWMREQRARGFEWYVAVAGASLRGGHHGG